MLNPSRIAFIDVLKKMGAKITVKKTKKICGEDIGTVKVKYSRLRGKNQLKSITFDYWWIPILAIAATQAKGKTIMKG